MSFLNFGESLIKTSIHPLFDWIHQWSSMTMAFHTMYFTLYITVEGSGKAPCIVLKPLGIPTASVLSLVPPAHGNFLVLVTICLLNLEWQWRWCVLHPRESLEPIQNSTDPFLLSVMANKGLDCGSLSLCIRVRPWLGVGIPSDHESWVVVWNHWA